MALRAFWRLPDGHVTDLDLPVLMHLMALRAFWPTFDLDQEVFTPRLNAPYGTTCFLAKNCGSSAPSHRTCLNAPYGTPCFLAARRVAPAVTRGNDTSDRQGPKKHESDPHARRQISRLFIAIRRIATDGQQHSSHPGNSRSRRSVAPLHACTTPHAKQPTNLTQTRTPPTRPIPHTEAGTHRTAQRDGPRPRIGA